MKYNNDGTFLKIKWTLLFLKGTNDILVDLFTNEIFGYEYLNKIIIGQLKNIGR